MAGKPKIPVTTVNRLSLYLRVFSQIEATGDRTVSSRQLAELSGINPAQVRKDLAYFGQFGRRGVGHDGRSEEAIQQPDIKNRNGDKHGVRPAAAEKLQLTQQA